MKNFHTRNNVGGTALVLSLLILLIMTIIGVATMSNIQMQERMAGNVNVQAIAFEAASAGVSEALEYGMAEWEAEGCSRDEGSWNGTWSSSRELDLLDDTPHGIAVRYQLRADCLEDPDISGDPSDPTFLPPVQMFVTSRGMVFSGTDLIANREIEVRIDDFRVDGRSAIRIEGKPQVIFGAANSNSFFVDGFGGPAISASTQDNATRIATAIGDARMANYSGGVASSQYGPPFNRADAMRAFALRIRAFMEDVDTLAAGPGVKVYPAADCLPGLENYERGLLEEYYDFLVDQGAGTVSGTTFNTWDLMTLAYDPSGANPKYFSSSSGSPDMDKNKDFDDFYGIHYVTGNLVMKGNPSGGGIVIVEGNVDWRGTAQFKGLILALGGEFKLSGLGQGHTEGMLFATNVDLPSFSSEFGKINTYLNATPPHPPTVPVPLYDLLDPSILPSLSVSVLMDIPTRESMYFDMDFYDMNLGTDAFGATTMNFAGGGKHVIDYDCRLVDAQRVVLKCLGIDGHDAGNDSSVPWNVDFLWASQQCNTPGRGGAIQAIRSWRENLGWRELLTGS